MAFWATLKTSLKEANEQAHAERLFADLGPTLVSIDNLQNDLRDQTLIRFLELREVIGSECNNWSREGGLSVARNLFQEAKKFQDLNRKESLAYALTGLWLESGIRGHPKAADVHMAIERIALAIQGGNGEGLAEILELGERHANPNAIDSNSFTSDLSTFGFSKDNPIPCHSEDGCEIYLQQLRFGGNPIRYRKIMEHGNNITGMPVYEYLISPRDVYDERRWRIFLSPYQLRNSHLAPGSFTLS